MSNKTNDQIAEELKQQLDTAVDMKDFARADEINSRIIDLLGYGIDFDDQREEDPNYED